MHGHVLAVASPVFRPRPGRSMPKGFAWSELWRGLTGVAPRALAKRPSRLSVGSDRFVTNRSYLKVVSPSSWRNIERTRQKIQFFIAA